MAFKIGDGAQLKHGSPIMTVTGLGKDREGNQIVTCTWLDSANRQQTAAYPEEALMAYSGEKGSTDPIDDN